MSAVWNSLIYTFLSCGRFCLTRIPFGFQASCIRMFAFLLCVPYVSMWKRRYKEKSWYEAYILAWSHLVGRFERQVWRLSFTPHTCPDVTIHGKNHLDDALGSSKGIIFASVHQSYMPPSVYWFFSKVPHLNPIIVKNPTEKNHPSTYSVFFYKLLAGYQKSFHQRGGSLSRLVKNLKNQGAVVLLQDEEKPTEKEVLLFGKKTRLNLGSLRLAQMGNAVIVPYILGNTKTVFASSKWEMHFLQPIDPDEKNAEDKLLTSLEEIMCLYPEHTEKLHIYEPIAQKKVTRYSMQKAS